MLLLPAEAIEQISEGCSFLWKVENEGLESLNPSELKRWLLIKLDSFKIKLQGMLWRQYEDKLKAKCRFFGWRYPRYPHGDPYNMTEKDLLKHEKKLAEYFREKFEKEKENE